MYISREYLREKYNSFKRDMEDTINVLDEDKANNRVSEEDAKRVIGNIEEKAKAIIDELGKFRY